MRSMREKRGLTQKQLSQLVGASERQIRYWEQGTNGEHLSFVDAVKIADVFCCSLDDLAGRDWPAKDAPDLSPGEAELLETYRSASDTGQRSIETTARAMAEEFPRDKGGLEPPVELRA